MARMRDENQNVASLFFVEAQIKGPPEYGMNLKLRDRWVLYKNPVFESEDQAEAWAEENFSRYRSINWRVAKFERVYL